MSTPEPTNRSPSIQRSEPSVERSAAPPTSEASLGDLVSRMTDDLSNLFRKEVELAKIEIKEEATKAAKGAGLLGGTGMAALFCLIMLSFAAAWGLAEIMPTGFAFLIMGGLYGVGAAIFFVAGRARLRKVHPVPEQTVETVKEDIQWAKNPTP